MHFPFSSAVLATLSASQVVSAFPLLLRDSNSSACSSPVQRRSWTDLTDDEKLTYLEAEKCLMTTEAQYGIDGAVSIWDELQYVHLRQSNFIHGVGAFLPWHRYYMTLHETLLQTHCGWIGGVPYWKESVDADDILESPIWNATYGIGGDGTGNDSCVADGPFSDLMLRWQTDFTVGDEYCLSRSISEEMFENAAEENIETCYASEDFDTASDCYGSSVHASAHGGTGGVMKDPVLSPGDPVFFLHHTNLDRLYWEWQEVNSTRLETVSGRNTPTEEFNTQNGWDAPGREFTDYCGDDGNVTTLNHVLWMVGIIPNVTIGDVLDINSETICAEYV